MTLKLRYYSSSCFAETGTEPCFAKSNRSLQSATWGAHQNPQLDRCAQSKPSWPFWEPVRLPTHGMDRMTALCHRLRPLRLFQRRFRVNLSVRVKRPEAAARLCPVHSLLAVFAKNTQLPVDILFGKSGFINPTDTYYARRFTLDFGAGASGISYEVALQVCLPPHLSHIPHTT